MTTQPDPQQAPLAAQTPAPAQAQASTTPPQDPKPGEIDPVLTQSIEDAYTLLNFACRNFKSIDDTVTQAIIESHNAKLAKRPLNTAQEGRFWTAFTAVINVVNPVTVESIIYTSAKGEGTLSRYFLGTLSQGERILRRYLFLAIFTLLALLLLQVEWAMGTAIYNNAYTVHANYLESITRLGTARDTAKAVSGTEAATQAQAAVKHAETAFYRDQSWHNVSYSRLWWWNRQVASWIPPYDLENGKNETPQDVSLDSEGKLRMEITRAELTLNVISNYFLVTLFALLGALTHVLRTLSHEMENVSLTPNEVFRAMIRIILGVISGVCMAWLYLIGSEAPPGTTGAITAPLDAITLLGAFTPWALAFISGYSVEIFFAALERAITTITEKISGKANAAAGSDAPSPQASEQPAPPVKAPQTTPPNT